MKNTIIALTAASFLLSSCCEEKSRTYNEGINIIPEPLEMNVKGGEPFELSKNTLVYANSTEAKTIAEFFVAKMNISTGYSLSVTDNKDAAAIELDIEDGDGVKGSYELSVSDEGVKVGANTADGIFYGMQSFLQLLPAEIESPVVVECISWVAPAVEIEDSPRFQYRGVMLDPCRHFMPVDFVKKQLDVMAMFKINRMHWHLTEDQGWRIEIKKYPKLAEIASKRIEGEGFEYGGYYTQEQVKEIVAYATDRFITVIPELELPGHELAAIAAYPHLSCTGEPTTPRIIWGVEDIVMCPGKEDMFVFIQDVIDEMVPLFPGEYFHIGGDECPKKSWEKCPRCQAKIRKEGFRDTKGHSAEEYLQSYVIKRAEQMLEKHGKKLIGWDEILEGGLAPSATVMSWRGESGGIAAANMGHDVIMTPGSGGMYIDHYQGDKRIEPVAIGGYATLAKTYGYDPVPESLIESGKAHHIQGVQTNLWSEYLYTTDLMEYRLYPRIVALAEIGWTALDNKNFDDFARRINNAYVRLDGHDINYHIPQPEQPFGSCNFVAFTDKATLEFKTTRPIKMVYTLDGSMPDANSTQYTQPIVVDQNTVLKICSVLPSGKTSPIRTIVVEKQALAPAKDVKDTKPGLSMKTTYGMFLNIDELNSQKREWKEKVALKLRDLRSQEKVDAGVRDVKHYAAIATGYLDIPEDGVYYFSSNNDQVWIDGKLLIDNKDEVKRFSRNDKSVALAKGLHEIKVVFLSHIVGGWPSIWDAADVSIRKEGTEKFLPITPEMLSH